ncbi:hypothetical protein LZG37_11225 [Halomonas titanicae]|uniref:hypothetical protein n=1 Tax=Vreelandella titanicae TaxID=664683 RepID=UPI001F46112C|nr:hypothetical protein [Halomonas titanicae]MCE7518708.1 hypothetical protein [Halomonas titanicae]
MKIVHFALLFLAILFSLLVFKSSGVLFDVNGYGRFFEKFKVGNEIVFNVSCGMLVSIWFYFLVVYMPDRFRKNRIKRNFISQYREFRKQVVVHILNDSKEPYSNSFLDVLMDVKEFKVFFHKRIKEDQNRWYIFRSNVTNESLGDILLEFEAFQDAITILLINVDIQDEEVFSFLHRIRKVSIIQKNVNANDYFSFERVSKLLWEMLAGYSWKERCYYEFDHFEKMFEKI